MTTSQVNDLGLSKSGGGQQQEEAAVWREVFEWEVGFPVEQVWEVTNDFGNMHKWAPSLLASCSIVEGTPQQPGCVRRAEAHPAEPSATPAYALEKLLEYDPLSYTLSYVVVTSSFPFFVGLTPTYRLLAASPSSTKIIWSYYIEPLSCMDKASLRAIVLSSLYEICISDLIKTLSTVHPA